LAATTEIVEIFIFLARRASEEAAPRDAAKRGGGPRGSEGEGGRDETKRRIRKRQIETRMSETKKDIPVFRLGERKTGPPTSLTSDCERSTERFVTRARPSEISTVPSARV